MKDWSIKSIVRLALFLLTILMLSGLAEAQSIEPIEPTTDPDDEGQKYAYGETVDWFNFKPTYGGEYYGVKVTETEVTGFVWNQDIGWINLNPPGYGVTITLSPDRKTGALAGWAWSENTGWISFSCDNTGSCDTVDYGVAIDFTDGRFNGYAWGENIGWINFNLEAFPESAVITEWEHDIYGNTDIGEVTLTIEDGETKTLISGEDGDYSFTVPYGWDGTVTPSAFGYYFNPSSKEYEHVTTDLIDQDFTAVKIWPEISGNAGVGGATLTYEDNGTKTTTADSNGVYTLIVSYDWSGTVTPSMYGYVFDPPEKSYQNVRSDQIDQDYEATPITPIISGNAEVGGVVLAYNDGEAKTVETSPSGDYSFAVSYGWNGTVTPSKTGYAFDPSYRTYEDVTSDRADQNYDATPITPVISGNAGVGGAVLAYNDDVAKTETANDAGDYSFAVSYGWSGTVTPSKTGYTFDPSYRTYDDVASDRSGQNYIATAITPTISGNAGVGGAVLSYYDGGEKTATANEAGVFSFTVSYGWGGTVTPTKAGYIFAPSSMSYQGVKSDLPDQNFTAKVFKPTISGNTGIEGVTLTYDDGGARAVVTTVSDENGDYSFSVSYGWSGTVTPSKPGYVFSPSERTYENVTSDTAGQNYTAAVFNPTISGNAGVGGATLAYDDDGEKTVTADEGGDYSFSVPYGWSGTVTLSAPGYHFTPPSMTYDGVTADQEGQNYRAVSNVIPSVNAWGAAVLVVAILLATAFSNRRKTSRVTRFRER